MAGVDCVPLRLASAFLALCRLVSLRVTWPLELGGALPWLRLGVDGQERRGACAQAESPAPVQGEASAVGGRGGAPLRRAGSSCQMECGNGLWERVVVGVNDQNASRYGEAHAVTGLLACSVVELEVMLRSAPRAGRV